MLMIENEYEFIDRIICILTRFKASKLPKIGNVMRHFVKHIMSYAVVRIDFYVVPPVAHF